MFTYDDKLIQDENRIIPLFQFLFQKRELVDFLTVKKVFRGRSCSPVLFCYSVHMSFVLQKILPNFSFVLSSDQVSYSRSCAKCSSCGHRVQLRPCTSTHNSVCGKCKKGTSLVTRWHIILSCFRKQNHILYNIAYI